MYQVSGHHEPSILATKNRQTAPMKLPRILSIKLIAYACATIIVALFLAITVANLALTKDYYQPGDHPEAHKHLHDKAHSLDAQLGFFREILANLAKQPTTQDLLDFNDEAAAQSWAMQVRRFLPQAIGVALLNEHGRVLGEPASQRVGPLCITDLAKLSKGVEVKVPPVHREIAELAHFDLTEPVFDDAGNQLGLLFISFSLDTVQTLLKDSVETGQWLRLTDGGGELIAQAGDIEDTRLDLKLHKPVGNSNWTLELHESSVNSLPSFLSLTIFNVSSLLLIIGVTTYLMRFATRTLGSDFTQIKTRINGLAEGRLDESALDPNLRETAEILPALDHIHRDLQKQQQLLEQHSRTDELTHLANRRQFNLDFARAYDLARRGIPVCVVLMRLQLPAQAQTKNAERIVKELAKVVREFSRKIDLAARLEEDQFALLLFGMKEEGIAPCLQRLDSSFRERQEQHPGIPNDALGRLHCGYTLIHAHRDNNAAEVLRRAETALAEAEASDSERHIVAATA
jgi:GGDEF domain-containing protein